MLVGRTLGMALVAALLWAAPAWALDPGKPLGRYTVQVWQARDGLTGDTVKDLIQTPDHRIWVGTLGGVARFDGRSWSRLEAPSGYRTTAGEPNRLLVAADGAVWIFSAGRPLMRIAGDDVAGFSTAAGLESAGNVRAWTEQGGQLWVATSDGLFRFSGGRFVKQPTPEVQGPAITALAPGPGGAIWVGTTHGLYVWREGSLMRSSLGEQPVTLLHQDRGVLWAATGDRLVDVTSGRSFGRSDGLPASPITALAGDPDGSLWIGTGAGLVRLHDGRLTLHGRADGLPDEDVSAVLVDREGTLWVGTRRGGVAQFTDRTLDVLPLPGVPSGALDSMCQADDGALWFGTRGQGVVRAEPEKGGKVTIFTTRDGLPANTVPAVLPAGPGQVWIGTPRGLMRYRQGVFEDPKIWDRFVTGLYHDRAGNLWIAGNGELARWNGSLTVFRGNGLSTRQLRAVAEDPQGTIWVSALGGFVKLDGDRFVPPGLNGPRQPIGVRVMLTARDGTFWMTTVQMGLMRVTGNQLRIFDASSGIEPDRLSQLLEDDAGDLWLGTHNEIVRVKRESLDAVAEGRRSIVDTLSFDTTDDRAGVIAERIRQPSSWKARDGRLWFLTDQGPVVVDPRRVRANPVPPVVEIASATIDGRAAALTGRTRFPAGTGRLVVEYAGITQLQPSKVRYRHRLEGHDQGWIEAGSARSATYPTLGPGSYQFRVQARNNSGVWNEQGASLAFIVAPPYYQSPWFLGTCGLLAAGLVVAGHRLRVARLRAEYVLLFSERNRMARELHDTLLQGMSAVALQLGGLRAQTRDEALQRELAGMQDTVRRCLEEGRQAVWGLRERGRGQAGELGPTIERMVQRLCGAQAVDCDIEIEGTPVALRHAVEDELFRIAQESVTNALKHARPGLITVRLCYDAGSVTLTITDDGAGFDPAAGDPAADGHFGITGMRERAARVDGRLEVRSAPGQGTTVEVKVDRR